LTFLVVCGVKYYSPTDYNDESHGK